MERSNPNKWTPPTSDSDHDGPNHDELKGTTKRPQSKICESMFQKPDPTFFEKVFSSGWKHKVFSKTGSGAKHANLAGSILMAQAVASLFFVITGTVDVSRYHLC